MAESKRKVESSGHNPAVHRSFETEPPKQPTEKRIPTTQTTQLVLTLGGPNGDLIKIEKMGSGRRHEVSKAEFAAIAGDHMIVGIGGVLERAYIAGIEDAIDEDLEQAQAGNGDIGSIFSETTGRRIVDSDGLRREMRQLILRRALRRELSGQPKPQPKRKTKRRKTKH